MLITPIISGGIPEIPISGDNEYKVSIPFKHHPSIASEKTIYVRFVDSDGNIYTPSTLTINNAQFIECTISSFSKNTILKFQLSYNGIDWSPAVATKCINNPAQSLTMTQTGLGFEFIYDATIVGTKLSQLTIETDAKEKKKLNIQDAGTEQTAFCILNSISTAPDFDYIVSGTTVGGYSFSKNFTINNWDVITSSELLRITTPAQIEGIYVYNVGVSGILCHKTSDEDYWKPLTSQKSPYIYIDNNIIPGKQYEYQILTANTPTEEPAAAEFMLLNNDTENIDNEATDIIAPYQETMYLQDIPTKENEGELKTLYIEYNPQISSFKRVIQEQKVETIGNQYPIFVRNGHINYHEFSIGGLISYLMDPVLTEDEASRTGFYTEAEWSEILNKEQSTNLTPENIQREVQFRNDVINWLTDGKDKEFYSPTEGRMKVRLTNVQLTPETKLGRMIYSFTAQATEVGEIE